MHTDATAAVTDVVDDDNDDEKSDSRMTSLSIDFQSDKLNGERARVHHTSSFCYPSSLATSIHDRLSPRLGDMMLRRPPGRTPRRLIMTHLRATREYRIAASRTGQVVDAVAGQRPSIGTRRGGGGMDFDVR